MKNSLLFLVLLASQNLLADVGQILIDGRPDQSIQLSSEETHTEYRQEQQTKTCYRDVPDGYDQVCSGGGQDCRTESNCRPTPDGGQACRDEQVCRPAPQDCHSEPRYRSEAYSCTETISVPYQVKDYDVQASVAVHTGVLPAGLSAHELLSINLNGANINLSAQRTSRQLLIYARVDDSKVSVSGRLKKVDAQVYLRFLDLAKTVAPIQGGVQNLSVTNNQISFVLGKVDAQSPVKIHLRVKRQRWLGSDTIVEQDIALSQLSLTAQGDRTLAQGNLDQLGVMAKLSRGYYHLWQVSASIDVASGSLLNASDLPNLQPSQELKTPKQK